MQIHSHPFIGGVLIGLVLALPTGPGAFMVFNQGIRKPITTVFKSAFVCMLVDLIWNITLCAFGDTSLIVVSFITEHKELIRASAGPILIGIGLYAIRSLFLTVDVESGIRKTVAVTLLNPLIPVTLTTLITYIIGDTYFTSAFITQFSVISGIFLGEAIMWVVGIRLFHWLLCMNFPERGIPLFFISLFLMSGTYLTIKGFFSG